MELIQTPEGLAIMTGDQVGQVVDEVSHAIRTLNDYKNACGDMLAFTIIGGGKVGVRLTLKSYC
jgi:hypothetical protein